VAIDRKEEATNEALEIGVAHSTCEAGELSPEEPVEGRGNRFMEAMEGKMARTLSQTNILTKLNRVVEQSQARPDLCWTTLAHLIDIDFLKEAYRLCSGSSASGIDGETKASYGANLDDNLESLLNRFKSGTYRAPSVRRVYLPKDNGDRRPIGLPTIEDKILQRAVTMVLSAVYETDFYPFSYGFRPNRSAHQALEQLRDDVMNMGGCFVLELDIKSYFDSIPHAILRSILDKRIRDGVMRKSIDKWLKAGVMENGRIQRMKNGTPQGGVISPMLANIYLHEVLDVWYEQEVKPRMRGRTSIIRFADDAVLLFEHAEDAHRVLNVLGKRFSKYGLELHPDKTRLLGFKRPPFATKGPKGPSGYGSFDFLGFTHYWGRSRRGYWVVLKKTSKNRLSRALKRANLWCRLNRHLPVDVQQKVLAKKLLGHYSYYGVTGNSRSIAKVYRGVTRYWRKWLSRRSWKAILTWKQFRELMSRHPLPAPRIVHSYLVARP